MHGACDLCPELWIPGVSSEKSDWTACYHLLCLNYLLNVSYIVTAVASFGDQKEKVLPPPNKCLYLICIADLSFLRYTSYMELWLMQIKTHGWIKNSSYFLWSEQQGRHWETEKKFAMQCFHHFLTKTWNNYFHMC